MEEKSLLKTQLRAVREWVEYSSRNQEHNSFDVLARDAINKRCAEHYLQPTSEQINSSHQQVVQFLRDGRASLVIPMREQLPVVTPLLDTITQQMKQESIFVINDRSGNAALDAVRRFNVPLFNRDDILDILDWDKLLPILNLGARPQGKGVTILAGYLLQYILAQFAQKHPQWIFQHDSDVVEYHENKGLEYLVWGILNGDASTHHVKMAQTGRNNERCMSARSSLLVLSRLEDTSDEIVNIKARATDLFMKMSPFKWMLSGQFALTWETAMQRPFATGYLEETLMCAFIEDLGALSNQVSTQVANPNQCLDGLSDYWKEDVLQQSVSNFFFTMAFFKKPVHEWDIEDIRKLNHTMMSKVLPVTVIPPDQSPITAEILPDERVIPSIMMLVENNFVRPAAIDGFIDCFLKI